MGGDGTEAEFTMVTNYANTRHDHDSLVGGGTWDLGVCGTLRLIFVFVRKTKLELKLVESQQKRHCSTFQFALARSIWRF